MLLITQGRDIPVLKKALPVFEDILAKKDLYLLPHNPVDRTTSQPQPEEKNIGNDHEVPQKQDSRPQAENSEYYPLFEGDLLGLDFLDEWQIGELDSVM